MRNKSRSVRATLGLVLAGLAARGATGHAQAAIPAPHEFVVDSSWDRGASGAMPATPDAEPPATAWRSTAGPRYSLTITSGGRRIEIRRGSDTLAGHLESRGPNGRRYALDQRTFAGGRFVLSNDGSRG